jgi:hypothetical protein
LALGEVFVEVVVEVVVEVAVGVAVGVAVEVVGGAAIAMEGFVSESCRDSLEESALVLDD